MTALHSGRIAGPSPSCPVCARTLDGFTCAEGDVATPDDGDVTVCIYCGVVLVVQRIVGVTAFRQATDEELVEFLDTPEIGLMVQTIHAAMLRRQGGRA